MHHSLLCLTELARILRLLCCLTLVSVAFQGNTQSLSIGTQYWADVQEPSTRSSQTRYIIPSSFRSLSLNVQNLQAQLSAVPHEQRVSVVNSNAIMQFPMPDGSFEAFRIVESPVMEAALAARYPEIKTYMGQGVDHPEYTVRFDVTPAGFHAMIMGTESTVYIDPYAQHMTSHYISYYRRDFLETNTKTSTGCQVIEHPDYVPDPINRQQNNRSGRAVTGSQLRTYRIAVAATGEYTSFHGGTVLAGQSAIVTTINRVNQVYERDFTIRMVIVANNDTVVYTNAGSDPFSNNSASALINEIGPELDDKIGNANYDIGHVVSTGGGGLAGLGVVCNNSRKGDGVTGTNNPIGDPFDIDYVAHEIGHQFGGPHTFNGSGGSCGSNRSGGSAWEPGSGTTIMAYAGICSPDNIQSNSDDHFHVGTINTIVNYSQNGTGDGCPVKTNTGNNLPVADAGTGTGGKSIPISTPFQLTGSATDGDVGDVLTYHWEEFDLGPQGAPNSPSGDAPIFRSFSPGSSTTRIFPQISDIVNGTQTMGELLPTYSRNLTFKFVVRDNQAGAGGVDHDEVSFAVTDAAGPFLVTAPNTAVTWSVGASETVTWDVASTNIAPVSCATVNILLSTDGGLTYPVTLLSGTANDGSASVTVPNNISTNCRVKVEAADNIFFDISNTNFTIEAPAGPDFSISNNPSADTACTGTNQVVTVTLTAFNGFSDPVTLSASGLPTGAAANFSPNPANGGSNSTLTISNLTAAGVGVSNVVVNGVSGALNRDGNFTLTVAQTASKAVKVSPADEAQNVAVDASFLWRQQSGAVYDIALATDANFTSIVTSQNGLSDTSFTPSTSLADSGTYYWRVRARTLCTTGEWSDTCRFETQDIDCINYASTDVPLAIPSSGTVTSTFNIPDDENILDLNITNLAGTHTYINDLIMSVTSPSSTSVTLFSQVCDSQNDFDLNFDDEAGSSSLPCPPTGGGTYQPSGSLADFNGESSQGNWTLTIEDSESGDGGLLSSWTVQVCTVTFVCGSPDASVPTITCPPNSSVVASGVDCDAVVNYSVTATDNCSGVITSLSSGLPSGANFPLGVTTNNWVAKDTAGNEAICSFNVTVSEGAAPAEPKYSMNFSSMSAALKKSDRFGYSVAYLDDLDGDGVNEMAVGAPLTDPLDPNANNKKRSNAGAVYVLFPNTAGDITTTVRISQDTEPTLGLINNDKFGTSVAWLGDLGNGQNILAVGAIGADDNGKDIGGVFLLDLDASASVVSSSIITASAALKKEEFGASIALLEDLDGDGTIEIACGAPRTTPIVGGKKLSRAGGVYIMSLQSDATVTNEQRISSDAGSYPQAIEKNDFFGTALAWGDFDGDGDGELAVSAIGDDDGPTKDVGGFSVMNLNVDGTVASITKIADQTGGFTGSVGRKDLFGQSLANLGDLDANGVDDIGAGAPKDDDFPSGTPGTDRGAAYVIYMNNSGLVDSDRKIGGALTAFPGTLDKKDLMGYGLAATSNNCGTVISIGTWGDDDGGIGLKGKDHGAVWNVYVPSIFTARGESRPTVDNGETDEPLADIDLIQLNPEVYLSEDLDLGISIYPNPTEGRITIEWTKAQSGDYTISVFNIEGKEVYTDKGSFATNEKLQADLSQLQAGSYLIEIRSNSQSLKARLIKN